MTVKLKDIRTAIKDIDDKLATNPDTIYNFTSPKSIGDVTILCELSDGFYRTHGKKFGLCLSSLAPLKQIANMFGVPVITFPVELYPYIVLYYNSHRRANLIFNAIGGCDKFHIGESIYKPYGVFLGISENTQLARPNNNKDFEPYGHEVKKPGRTVFIAKEAQSFPPLSEELWRCIEQLITEMGYDVVCNGKWLPLDCTIPYIEKCGIFIGLRSGFCDLVRYCSARKFILYSSGGGILDLYFDEFNIKDDITRIDLGEFSQSNKAMNIRLSALKIVIRTLYRICKPNRLVYSKLGMGEVEF
jgi:hypothetical protein